MKIRMISTQNGSTDGIRVSLYEADKEYDLTATDGERDLAEAFVGAGMAEICVDAKAQLSDAPSGEQIDVQAIAPVRAKPGRKPK